MSFHIQLTEYLPSCDCITRKLPYTRLKRRCYRISFNSSVPRTHFLLSYYQATSMELICIMIRITEPMPWSGHRRTNAVDLRYPLFLLQSEADCAEQELSFSSCYQDELFGSLTLVCYLRRQGFNRQNEGTGSINTSQQRANGSPNPSPTTFSPTMPPLNQSSSFSSNTGPSSDNVANNVEQPAAAEPPNFFFREKYAKLGVKGNFMPLAAQPANVDLADWLAHQSA